MTKEQMRKALQQGMSLFISGGGQITKCKPVGQKKKSRKQEPVEEVVEIEIDHLPPVLRAKYFSEE